MPLAYPWRSRHVQQTIRASMIYNSQLARFTRSSTREPAARKEDTNSKKHKKIGADTAAAEDEKREWLMGNNLFTVDVKPTIMATEPLTGTGYCTMPTTTMVLARYFDDPFSSLVFTNTLELGLMPDAMTHLEEVAKRLMVADHNDDPFIQEIRTKVAGHAPYEHFLRSPIHWSLAADAVKPEWRHSDLLRWVTFRINWAIDKQQYIKQLYYQQIGKVNVGAWTYNAAYAAPSATTTNNKDSSSSHHSVAAMFRAIPDLLKQNRGIQMVNLNLPSMPNTSFRATHFPIFSDDYNALISGGYMASSVSPATPLPPLPSKSSEVFTTHRYWAMYYLKLLDRFIQAHAGVCRALCIEDHFIKSHMAARTAETDDVLLQTRTFAVATVYQPFDEMYATWHWTPLRGHQGSRAILRTYFPTEVVLTHSLYDLYTIMQVHETPEALAIAKCLKARAAKIYHDWTTRPLFSPSLTDTVTQNWKPPAPFSKGNVFLWTYLCVVGQLDALQQDVDIMPIRLDHEAPGQSEAVLARRRAEVRDFIHHQLQVRKTAYLATSRWMLNTLLINRAPNNNDNDSLGFSDETLPEPVVFFPYEDLDVDGEMDLPNFEAMMQSLNFWKQTSNDIHTNPIIAAIHKGLPYKSHGRVLSDNFHKIATTKRAEFANFAMMLVVASGMGLYRAMSGAPPSFRPSFAGLSKIDFALLQTPTQLFNFFHVRQSKVPLSLS